MKVHRINAIYTYKTDKMAFENKKKRASHILSYQVSGRYDHFVNGEMLPVSAGCIFFVNRDDLYSVKCREKGESICITVEADTDIPTRLWDFSDKPEAEKLFFKLLNIKELNKKSSSYLAMGYVYQILSLIEKKEEERVGILGGDSRLVAAREYVLEHLGEGERDCSTLAELCRVSERHLRTLFKRAFGATPNQYSISVRMNAAAKLLKESSLSVGEVAEMIGMTDVYYFSKQFKAHFGISPSKFSTNAVL